MTERPDVTAATCPQHMTAVKRTLTSNTRLDSSIGWTGEELTLEAIEARLLNHSTTDSKADIAAFVPGVLIGDQRTNAAVQELHFVVLDSDKGDRSSDVVAVMEANGLAGVIYSTHSHGVAETEINVAAYHQRMGADPITAERAVIYLRDFKQYRPWVIDGATVEGRREGPRGAVYVVHHAPVEKFRVVLPLSRPFRRQDHPQQFEPRWKESLLGVAAKLGLRCDPSCTDVGRAFYYPSRRPGVEPVALKVEGACLEVDSIAVTADAPARMGADLGTYIFNGLNLTTWIARYGRTFAVACALLSRAPTTTFGAPRAEGGMHIICPYEAEHSEPGGSGTFVADAAADGSHGFRVHCCHTTCLTTRGDGKSCDRLPFIMKFLDNGWLAQEDLLNPVYGGGPVSTRVVPPQLSSHKRLERAIDREGKGIDLTIFHAQKVAKGLLDFERINELCKIQIGPDITVAQLTGFVQSGLVTREQLATCASPQTPLAEPEDPYVQQLRDLAARAAEGKVNARQKDDELARLRIEFKVKQKTIERDYGRYAQEQGKGDQRDWRFGILTADETALITATRSYVDDFAIVNTGGKGAVLALQQPDLSKAIMTPQDFVFLQRRDWVEVVGEDGRTRTIHPAEAFITKPPKETRVYNGGFVFRPAATVAADEFNLYRGMLIEPDPSGTCSLFYDLLRVVWAQGNPDVFAWICEWLWHIFAFPGEKIGTTLAIRGGYGDGKSIVFEGCLSTVLGDMLLRVANPKMILGDFNESLLGKLMIVLEEAAFVGDKAAFDKMKELITGNKVLINPKFKAPITVDNYARLVVISNHEHFLHIKPGDRRYTVLESSAAWKGTNKFEQLLEQWRAGGAARFLYDALNYSFRRIEGRQTPAISTNIITPVAVRQMAQSRSSLERCIVEFVLKGSLHKPKEPWMEGPASWDLDRAYEIGSQSLFEQVREYLRSHDPVASRHEASLNQIIGMLHTYIGETAMYRDKKRDLDSGQRLQLPTSRLLPPRKSALDHAVAKYLITPEEYQSALPRAEDLRPPCEEEDKPSPSPQDELFPGDDSMLTRVRRYGWTPD